MGVIGVMLTLFNSIVLNPNSCQATSKKLFVLELYHEVALLASRIDTLDDEHRIL